MSMQKHAWNYVYAIFALTFFVTCYALIENLQPVASAELFWTLLATTTVMRLFVVEGPQHRSYEGSTVALFASVLLLAEWQFLLVVLISFSVEWFKQRWTGSSMLRHWYVQPFNMAKTILGGMAVYLLIDHYHLSRADYLGIEGMTWAVAMILLYVAVNQIALAIWLRGVRGVTLRQTGMVQDGLLIEIPLASIGYVAVLLLEQHYLLALFMLAPIALIYQSFQLPKIQADAMTRLEDLNAGMSEAYAEIQQLNDELFLTLAKFFDARDPYVGSHAAQVAAYAVAIAEEMKLPADRIEVVRQSAYLHDIGKIAIPEAILHKPSRLTDVEYEFVKKHAQIGAEFLETSHGMRHLAPFIRHHHERWDGKGYPDGLAGEEIPLEARILNVCDSVEAMASDRPYHKALSTAEIVKEIIDCAGSQFDPSVAKAFIHIAEQKGQELVVNSARTVITHHVDKIPELDGLKLKQFAQIYGLASP